MSKTMYYVYHVPGVKVGMTKDLGDRVFEQQGYEPHEFELLYMSRDMESASQKELEYQKALQYPVDRQSYKDLMKKQKPKVMSKFKINITDMTTTFPCYARELESYLMDNRGRAIELNNGQKFVVNDNLIGWCKKNARTSMYNNDRCYVYNKAMTKAIKSGMPPAIAEAMEMNVIYDLVSPKTSCGKCIFPAIREWATERGLYDKGDVKTQYIKLQEEAGEVARAIIKNDLPEIKDGIGDMVVVLTNLAHLAGLEIEDCIQAAYDVISKRKGSMINGSFVKNETL
jgi:NTP pyrophosphatase (non-canonical NTP hydrolase)